MTFLLDPEKKELLSQLNKTREVKIYERLKVVLWFNEGKTKESIAELLYLSPQTIHRYIQEYSNNKNLKPNHKGSISKLSKDQGGKLSNHLEKKTYIKVKEISDYVSKTYDIKYSNSGLTNWLHENNFVYKKPKGTPSKLNRESQKEFIETYRKLEESISEEEEILFIDSCHPTQSTKLEYGWIKKGKEKQIKTTGSKTRINITGAVNIESRAILTSNYDKIDTGSTIDFFKKIRSKYPEAKTINVVLDQASYHRSKEVKKYIETTNIKLHYLPPYSPNLNPIERLWKIMNEYARDNIYFENAKSFKNAINDFFSSTIPIIPEILKNRINSNFQIITNSS